MYMRADVHGPGRPGAVKATIAGFPEKKARTTENGKMPINGLKRLSKMRAIFVQIKCEMGHAYRVAQLAADTVPELSEMYSTSGQYDLLGKFYLEAGQDIGRFVTEQLQTIDGVRDTYTLITFNAFTGAGG
jgi:DNA-binding Lrp family transcriptional regulator